MSCHRNSHYSRCFGRALFCQTSLLREVLVLFLCARRPSFYCVRRVFEWNWRSTVRCFRCFSNWFRCRTSFAFRRRLWSWHRESCVLIEDRISCRRGRPAFAPDNNVSLLPTSCPHCGTYPSRWCRSRSTLHANPGRTRRQRIWNDLDRQCPTLVIYNVSNRYRWFEFGNLVASRTEGISAWAAPELTITYPRRWLRRSQWQNNPERIVAE